MVDSPLPTKTHHPASNLGLSRSSIRVDVSRIINHVPQGASRICKFFMSRVRLRLDETTSERRVNRENF